MFENIFYLRSKNIDDLSFQKSLSQSALQHCIANMQTLQFHDFHYFLYLGCLFTHMNISDWVTATDWTLQLHQSQIPNSQLNSSQPMSISDPRVLSWSILNISNNSWPIWPRDMKEKTCLWSHDLFTISPQQHLLKHNMTSWAWDSHDIS